MRNSGFIICTILTISEGAQEVLVIIREVVQWVLGIIRASIVRHPKASVMPRSDPLSIF